MKEHKHYIIVIMNEDKLLQYYDNRWKSYLFLNTKEDLSKYVSTKLNDKINNIELLDDIVHQKYSIPHHVNKLYHHIIYKVTLEKNLPLETFKINGIEYKWFSIEELKNNKRIQEVNSDIVNFVIKKII